MKYILITVIFLVSAVGLYAQNSFSAALVNLDTNSLNGSPEVRQDQIHQQLVLETIGYEKKMGVRIETEAAEKLDKIYTSASEVAASESENSENWQLFPANRKRFFSRLISEAEPQAPSSEYPKGILLITTKTIEEIKQDLSSSSFCPCWPFCK